MLSNFLLLLYSSFLLSIALHSAAGEITCKNASYLFQSPIGFNITPLTESDPYYKWADFSYKDETNNLTFYKLKNEFLSSNSFYHLRKVLNYAPQFQALGFVLTEKEFFVPSPDTLNFLVKKYFRDHGIPNKKIFQLEEWVKSSYDYEPILGKQHRVVDVAILNHEYSDHILSMLLVPDVVVESISRNMSFFFEVAEFLDKKYPSINFKEEYSIRQYIGPAFIESFQNGHIIHPEELLSTSMYRETVPNLNTVAGQILKITRNQISESDTAHILALRDKYSNQGSTEELTHAKIYPEFKRNIGLFLAPEPSLKKANWFNKLLDVFSLKFRFSSEPDLSH